MDEVEHDRLQVSVNKIGLVSTGVKQQACASQSNDMDKLYDQLKSFLSSLGRDVYVKSTKSYYGFWHNTGKINKVFAYVHINQHSIDIDVKPSLLLKTGLVSSINGKVCTRRISLHNTNDLMEAKSLLRTCYQNK